MKRVIIVFLMLIYCSTAFLFNHYGKNIRGMLSPKVETTELEYSPYGITVPSKAIHTEKSGRSYVYFAIETDRYPEAAYEAERADVVVCESYGGESIVLFGAYSTDEKLLIVSADKEVVEQRRVIPK